MNCSLKIWRLDDFNFFSNILIDLLIYLFIVLYHQLLFISLANVRNLMKMWMNDFYTF